MNIAKRQLILLKINNEKLNYNFNYTKNHTRKSLVNQSLPETFIIGLLKLYRFLDFKVGFHLNRRDMIKEAMQVYWRT